VSRDIATSTVGRISRQQVLTSLASLATVAKYQEFNKQFLAALKLCSATVPISTFGIERFTGGEDCSSWNRPGGPQNKGCGPFFFQANKPQEQSMTTYIGSWFYSFYYFWPRHSSG
jgi:hypothetical protein